MVAGSGLSSRGAPAPVCAVLGRGRLRSVEDLDVEPGDAPRQPDRTLAIGDRVEMIRRRPLLPGGVVYVEAGDAGQIVGVTETAYAIELLGVVAIVFHDDVRPVF